MILFLWRSFIILASMMTLGFFAVLFLVFGPTNSGFADQFTDLLGEAVEQGTQVDAARSRRDAAESSVRKAWSKFLPSIEAFGDFGNTRNNALGRLNGNRNSYDSSQYGVSASLPIYHGGSNYYGFKEAKSNAKAERHSYVETKQVLLLETVRAILGIIRDREIVRLQRKNQEIVASVLRTTQSRFEGGEATRTDIAIAEDQFYSAQSVYTQAIDNLNTNEIDFKRIIGRKAGRLSLPKGLPARLPKSLNEAIALAEEQNPQLLAAIFRSEAADHSLKASYGGFLPKVDLNLDYKEERFHGAQIDDDSDLTVKLNFTVPLFKPEAIATSDVNRHISQQRKYEARDARLTAKAMATVAWKSYHTAKKRYRLGLVRIKAAKEASQGMRRELEAGQRTVLDVLNTQERLVQAKVQSENARFEKYMAAHLLLSAIGHLDITTSNVAQLNDYVASKKARGRSSRQVSQTASINRKKSKKAVVSTASLKARDQSVALYGNLYASSFNKTPDLPVLKNKVLEKTKLTKSALTKPKLTKNKLTLPRLVVQPVVQPKKVQQSNEIVPKKHPTKTIKIIPNEEQKKQLLRKSIYSRLEKSDKLSSDDIITGSINLTDSVNERVDEKVSESTVAKTNLAEMNVAESHLAEVNVTKRLALKSAVAKTVVVEPKDAVKKKVKRNTIIKEILIEAVPEKEVVGPEEKMDWPEKAAVGLEEKIGEKIPLPLFKGREIKRVNSFVKVADYRRRHQAFKIHKIPLPVKKVFDPDDLVTGSLSTKKAPFKDEAKQELYPATYQNRFAVWWNDKVDKVIGPSGQPKPVLVDLKKYRKHREALAKNK